MNKKIFVFAILLVCFNTFISIRKSIAQTIAFPTAVGFGKDVTGGRGGTVYHVTNLNDSGAGSFRDAVSVSNRIIVFDVSGYITLLTAVSCKSNLTIAGQTAPGEGIGFKGGEISFAKSSNIICRYIRIRPGSETASTEDDALSLYLARDVIMDHCSFSFAPWNNIDGVSDDYVNRPVTNITFQNCIISNPTGQQFGAHCESVNSNWTWAYNIFANSHNRNPLDKVNDIFVNNVLYNCSAGYTTHTSTNFKHDIINNYFIKGPASTGTDNQWYQVDKNQSIYYTGNLKDSNLDGILNGTSTTPYWYQGAGTILTAPWSTLTNAITTYSAATAYRYAASVAGTFPHDQMDQLVMSQIRKLGSGTTGTGANTCGPGGALYTSQTQTGLGNDGYGTIVTGTKPTDTDNDGMPDFWEKTFGLNGNSNDAMTKGSDGYANIEKYINWLAEVHAQTLQNTAVDLDLSTYAGGFANVSPTFTVSNALNGTVALTGTTAHFTPATNFSGMSSYTFTIKGSDGTAFTFTVSVVVEPSGTACITPAATITATGNTTFCEGGNVKLNANAGTGLTYQWKIGTTTISGATAPSYTAAASGSYTVVVTKSSNCSTTSSAATVIANALPTVTITSPATSFCTGGSVVLTASTGASYKWFNGTTQVGTAATYTATTAGSYTVEVTNASGCKTTSAATTITVSAAPTATITTPATSFCTGGSVVLTASSGASYKWFNGSTQVGTAATYTATTAGSYTVEVTNASGCKATAAAKTITVSAAPTATITTPATSFCTGGSVVLTASTGASYKWFNGTTQVETAATYTAATVGLYTVEVTNTSGCKATSAPIQISIASSVTWYADTDNDGLGDAANTLSSCTKPNGYVATAGDVCPADAGKTQAGNCGCGHTEASCLDCNGTPNGAAFIDNCSVCVGGTTGNTACVTTATVNGTSANINVVPQPFDLSTTITVDHYGMIKSYTIISASGALVETRQGLNTTEVTLGEYIASGLYTVIISTEQGTYTTKIVKK